MIADAQMNQLAARTLSAADGLFTRLSGQQDQLLRLAYREGDSQIRH